MPESTSAAHSSLLPEPLRRPAWLLGTLVAPQVVLGLLNLRAWWLVAGEMTAPQAADAASRASCCGSAGWALRCG
jgi:hypothetical protein